jgi:DNA-binding ferritin-like protein
MIEILKNDYQALAQKTREVAAFAKSQGNEVTENMLIDKATSLEKAAWMLLSTLRY